jgi:hypothetical protein
MNDQSMISYSCLERKEKKERGSIIVLIIKKGYILCMIKSSSPFWRTFPLGGGSSKLALKTFKEHTNCHILVGILGAGFASLLRYYYGLL